MGEQAEMMIDGTLCNGCGTYVDYQAHGVPVFCEDCKPARMPRARKKGETRKVQCPECGKTRKKGNSIDDHMRFVHGIERA